MDCYLAALQMFLSTSMQPFPRLLSSSPSQRGGQPLWLWTSTQKSSTRGSLSIRHWIILHCSQYLYLSELVIESALLYAGLTDIYKRYIVLHDCNCADVLVLWPPAGTLISRTSLQLAILPHHFTFRSVLTQKLLSIRNLKYSQPCSNDFDLRRRDHMYSVLHPQCVEVILP